MSTPASLPYAFVAKTLSEQVCSASKQWPPVLRGFDLFRIRPRRDRFRSLRVAFLRLCRAMWWSDRWVLRAGSSRLRCSATTI